MRLKRFSFGALASVAYDIVFSVSALLISWHIIHGNMQARKDCVALHPYFALLPYRNRTIHL